MSEPIYRCSGCGQQLTTDRLCSLCANWRPILGRAKWIPKFNNIEKELK